MISSLERIKIFVNVIEANCYTAVAQQMKLSKAAISKQISSLEQELGVKLINRTTRRLKLTEGGLLYYPQCKRLLEFVGEMDALVSNMRKEPIGTLRLFCARYFGEHLIVPHLGEFMVNLSQIKGQFALRRTGPQFS